MGAARLCRPGSSVSTIRPLVLSLTVYVHTLGGGRSRVMNAEVLERHASTDVASRGGPAALSDSPDGEPPLYAARRKIYPQSVKGTFRRIKWSSLLIVTLAIYYFLPFVRWNRGPNAPDQAVLIDFPGRRFYFFFIEIWPQEVYFFTGLLIVAAMALFLMNAVAGRVWCGYLCPQTVWTGLSRDRTSR